MRHSLFLRSDRPLVQIPTPFSARNNSTSALEHSPFVESAIFVLIRQGCGTEVFEKPIIIINPLSVLFRNLAKSVLF